MVNSNDSIRFILFKVGSWKQKQTNDVDIYPKYKMTEIFDGA